MFLVIDKCPLVNLPETGRSHWGESLTAEKMKRCVWVKPKLAARIELRGNAGNLPRFRGFESLGPITVHLHALSVPY